MGDHILGGTKTKISALNQQSLIFTHAEAHPKSVGPGLLSTLWGHAEGVPPLGTLPEGGDMGICTSALGGFQQK